MPRQAAMEKPSAAVRVVPPTRQLLAQLRVLLNALKHTPVGVLQQVGFLLVLVVSVVEASLPTGDALSAVSIAGRAAGVAAHGDIAVTKDEQERAVKVLAVAKAKWARVNDLVGEGALKGGPMVKMETLRRWAVRRNRGVPRLLRLLQATADIGVDDALLVQHHAAAISPHEAEKALSAAAGVLAYVTMMSDDAIAKAHAAAATTNGRIEEGSGVDILPEPHHHGANTEHRHSGEEIVPADVAAALNSTRVSVVRVQALARGIAARRASRDVNAAATLIQTCERARRARRETASLCTAAAADRVQIAAAITVQGLWRGVMWRDVLFSKTVAAVTVQRWTRATTVTTSLARTRAIAQAHGAHALQFSTVCVEFRFRAMCHLSVSMSAHSRPYRTASTLVQRRWTTTVKSASLVAQGHAFDEAESLLRSLIRQRSQQAGCVGVVRASTADRWASGFDSPNTTSASPKAICPEVQDESWLASAETLSGEECARGWGKNDGESIGDSPSNDINCAARQRSCDVRSLDETRIDMGLAGVTPGGRANIENLPTLASDSLPASESNAASDLAPSSDGTPPSNRPSNDDRPMSLLDIDLTGPKLAPLAFTDSEHSELSSDGCSNSMPGPPDYGRPVRLPLDTPELHFAPVPIIFDFAQGVPTVSTPGRNGLVKDGVLLPTNDETGPTGESPCTPSPNRPRLSDRSPPAETPSSSPIPSSTTPSSPEGGRSCRNSPSHAVGRSESRSWWIPFPGDNSHASRTPAPLPGWRPAGNVDDILVLTEEESSDGHCEPPDSDTDLGTSTTDEIIIRSTAARERSFLERARLSSNHSMGSSSGSSMCSTEDMSPMSNSTGLPTKVGSIMDKVFDALRKTTEGEHLPAPTLISSGLSAPSSEDDSAPSPLGTALSGPAFTPSPHDESILPTSTSRGTSMQLALDGLSSADGVGSTERRRSSFSLPDQPAAIPAKQSTLHLAAGNTVPLSMAWERAAGGVGDQSPAMEEGAITLDQAIVWPSGSLTHTGLTTGTADGAQIYGGGSITGCNGNVFLGAGFMGPLDEVHQTSSLKRTSSTGTTPLAGTCTPSPQPSTPPACLEEWRCCERSPGHTAERPRGRSWWIPFSDATGHAIRTPPPLPSWLPAGGIDDILTDEENNHGQLDPPASDVDLHMGNTDEVIIMSPAPSSDDASVTSQLDIELPEFAPTPSGPLKSVRPTGIAHKTSMQLARDGIISADAGSSTERLQPACSPTERSASTVAMQPALLLAVGQAMASMVGWERATGGIAGQLPTIEEAAIALDDAIVWPSLDSTDIDFAAGMADETHGYGGGQIIGCNGDVVLSAASLALPLEAPRTPSPGRRRAPLGTPPSGTPSSPASTSPSAHSSPRRRRRREGSTSPTGRPRNLSRSVSPSDSRSAIGMPPSFPHPLQAGTVDAALADGGNRQGLPRPSVGEAVLGRNDTGVSDHDGTLSAPGSSIEVGRGSVSTVYVSDDANACMLRSKARGSFGDDSLRLLGKSGGDRGGVDNVSHGRSEADASQAPALCTSLPSVPLSDAGLNDVVLTGVDSNDVDIGLPLMDTKESVERIALECWLEDLESFDAAALPEVQSAGKGGRHTEGAALDLAARHASDEDSGQKPRYNPSAGVEEFKWSGLPNNNI